jgi:hypothetical protein
MSIDKNVKPTPVDTKVPEVAVSRVNSTDAHELSDVATARLAASQNPPRRGRVERRLRAADETGAFNMSTI